MVFILKFIVKILVLFADISKKNSNFFNNFFTLLSNLANVNVP